MTLLLKTTLLCAALGVLASSAGCRRVVILNFDGQMLPEGGATVDLILVTGITPQKDPRTLSGLQQTLGYYDVSTENIVVSVQACHGTELLADGRIDSPIVNDEVTLKLVPIPDPPRRCHIGPPQDDAGTAGSGGEGVGGTAGSGDLGQGGNGVGGAGGMTTLPPDGGPGDGGTSTDTAECGTDTHGSAICDPPTGAPVPPNVVPTPGCVQYCAAMLGPAGDAGGPLCPGIYTDAAECEAYCTLAQWPAGTDPQGDSLLCRNSYVMAAQASRAGSPARTASCQSAGPSGGGGDCGTKCAIFCHAWSLICSGDEASCMATCDLDIPAYAQATCRMAWLTRAAADPRYCPRVDLSSSCRPLGCPAP